MDERDKLVEKLREIAKGSRRSKISRLREVFDDIEAAKANGASNKTIVAGLAELGLVFDVNNFKNARSRILKERTLDNLTRSEPRHNSTLTRSKGINAQDLPTSQSASRSPVVRGHDPPLPKPEETVLVREPGITDAVWNERQQKHKAEQRRQRNLRNGENK